MSRTHSRPRVLPTALGLAGAALAAWQSNTLYPMQTLPVMGEPGRTDTAWYFDTVQTDGIYQRLTGPEAIVREGGWSGLERDTTDSEGLTFWSINDRGLNVGHEAGGRNDKVFPFPGYHHKLIRFRVDGDSLKLLSIDSIASLEDASLYTTGLVSTKAASGEIALRMRLDSAIVDTADSNVVAPVPNGYDFETVRRHGSSLFLSDEYGPFVVQLDLATKRIVKEWYPGHGLPAVLSKRRANRGMEAMAVTPSGKVVGILQSPMYNQASGGNTNATRDAEMLRVVWLDPATGETREFAYLTDLKSGTRKGRDVKVGDMIALSETRFVVLEHGKDKNDTYFIDLYEIDLSPATNVTAIGADGMLLGGKTLEEVAKTVGALADSGIVPVAKRLLSGDLLDSSAWVSQKPEGIAVVDDTTIALINDNDYGMTDFDADGIAHILSDDQRQVNLMYLKVPSLAARLADTAFASTGADFRLTLLHNNDGESQLLYATSSALDRGGIHRFVALMDSAKEQAERDGRAVVAVSAGDNFLAGKEWQASLDRDTSLATYDGMALDRVGYDALVLGNHDFDFGPDVLARFIRSFETSEAPFASANLSFENEPAMQALVESGRMRSSVVVEKDGQKVGIVGATTPTITTISSPRNTTIDTAIVASIQAQIDSMTAAGINKIVLVSHLQAVSNDTTMAKLLHGVDVMVAGGGDELLANGKANLQPGDTVVNAAYPIRVKDADGRTVYVVTTPGDYLYVGQLEVDFDASGEVIAVGQGSGPRRVVGGSYADSVTADAWTTTNVVEPVAAYVAGLSAQVVGTSNVGLDGVRANVRSKPTNLGALIADAMLWESWQLTGTYGFDSAVVALQNGGGIRNAAVLPAGEVTMSDVFDIVPFGNMFAVYPALPVTTLKDALENAYRSLPATAGQYGQIAGATVWVDTTALAATVDASGAMATRGNRVVRVVLDNGDTLVDNRVVLDSSRTIPFATIDFMARGGDGYPLASDSFVVAPIPQHIFVRDYIQEALGGTIDSTVYPLEFSGRVILLGDSSTTSVAAGTRRALSLTSVGNRLTASFATTAAGRADLEILDLAGRRVARVSRELQAGNNELSLSTASLGRGIYLVRIQAPGVSGVRTLHRVR